MVRSPTASSTGSHVPLSSARLRAASYAVFWPGDANRRFGSVTHQFATQSQPAKAGKSFRARV